MDAFLAERLRPRLTQLYGAAAAAVVQQIGELLKRWPAAGSQPPVLWDQRDVVLITYADQLRSAGEPPLATLRTFLLERQLQHLINIVHLLPFFPYSSDDGFSVIDYRAVDPNVGTWADVRRLGQDFQLMFDLVLNHVSRQHEWFRRYLGGQEPYTRYFLEATPDQDLSAVTRPRSLPLLTPVETQRGTRHVWTTFSADQIDLNYGEPAVLIEMLDVLLEYVARGARILRLDAIAYLWKEIGTSCIHLPQTHQVARLMRDVLDAVAPHVILLTETNVPHLENVSYFGAGDEARMVYQFSLPPLLLEAVLSQDTGILKRWLGSLPATAAGTTYFNFTASHDGIGVRPLEGMLSGTRLERLVEAIRQRGGLISTRRNPDGSDSPYELNISYVDAVGGAGDPQLQARRFLLTQAIMLALRGIPGLYFHSLVGTRNDDQGVRASAQPRRINRRRYEVDELRALLAEPESVQPLIFSGYRQLLQIRIRQPAFHPDAAQQVWDIQDPALLAFTRTSLDGQQTILVAANFSDQPRRLAAAGHTRSRFGRDLLTGQQMSADQTCWIEPWQVIWASGR